MQYVYLCAALLGSCRDGRGDLLFNMELKPFEKISLRNLWSVVDPLFRCTESI